MIIEMEERRAGAGAAPGARHGRLPKLVLTGLLIGAAAIALLVGHEPVGPEARVRPVSGERAPEATRTKLLRQGAGAGASCCESSGTSEVGSGAGSSCSH